MFPVGILLGLREVLSVVWKCDPRFDECLESSTRRLCFLFIFLLCISLNVLERVCCNSPRILSIITYSEITQIIKILPSFLFFWFVLDVRLRKLAGEKEELLSQVKLSPLCATCGAGVQ